MTTLIVGGGYAGLSAAFELSKAGKPFVLVEQELQLGGNSRGFVIDGEKIDPGVIVFYEWYYAFLDMMRQIDPNIQFDFKRNNFSRRSIWSLKSSDIANDPNLRKKLYNENFDTWSERSLLSVFKQLMFIRDKVNKGTISFGYPDPDALNASIISPNFLRSHMGVISCVGVIDIINAITKFIEPNGRIMVGRRVVSLNPPTLCNGEHLSNITNVVLANNVNQLHRQVVPNLGRISYTRLYVAVVELNKEPESFLNGYSHCIKNVCALYLVNNQNHGYLTRYNCKLGNTLKLIGLSDRFNRPLCPAEVSDTVTTYFGDSLVEIKQMIPYENTMPIIHPSDINKLQNAQGTKINNVRYYFAGQYLNFPSVEVACYTGRLAGKCISVPEEVPAFRAKYDKIDKKLEDEFMESHKNFNIIFFIFMLILVISIAYLSGFDFDEYAREYFQSIH